MRQRRRSRASTRVATLARVAVVLEVGKTRSFASAIDWPGWCRSGRSEEAALTALLVQGPRYERAISRVQTSFRAPVDISAFEVQERLAGGAVTDFGVPGASLAADSAPLDIEALQHQQAILGACWIAFARAVVDASGRCLRKGPRGGGRTVDQIVEHVTRGHAGYLRRIFWREPLPAGTDIEVWISSIADADIRALSFAASDEMPATGPRGGALWGPRYFARRAAWHILDHTWEIEDRLGQ